MRVVAAVVVPSHRCITVNAYVCIYSTYGHVCVGGPSSGECIAPAEVEGKQSKEREKEVAAIGN